MGFGIIRVTGNRLSLIEMGVLRMPAKKDAYERLHMIHEKVRDLLHLHRPTEFAIEAPFFGKNVQSMLKLGRAQGVAIATAMQAGIPVTEYSPRKIKQSITGNGNANKLQVLSMLQHLIVFSGPPASYDATDALAVAICHHFNAGLPPQPAGKSPSSGSKKNSWSDFITQNPSRIKG